MSFIWWHHHKVAKMFHANLFVKGCWKSKKHAKCMKASPFDKGAMQLLQNPFDKGWSITFLALNPFSKG